MSGPGSPEVQPMHLSPTEATKNFLKQRAEGITRTLSATKPEDVVLLGCILATGFFGFQMTNNLEGITDALKTGASFPISKAVSGVLNFAMMSGFEIGTIAVLASAGKNTEDLRRLNRPSPKLTVIKGGKG